jgi:hypothetical protein
VEGTRRIFLISFCSHHILKQKIHTWWLTGEHWEGRVLLKKALRNGFSGCIQATFGGSDSGGDMLEAPRPHLGSRSNRRKDVGQLQGDIV